MARVEIWLETKSGQGKSELILQAPACCMEKI